MPILNADLHYLQLIYIDLYFRLVSNSRNEKSPPLLKCHSLYHLSFQTAHSKIFQTFKTHLAKLCNYERYFDFKKFIVFLFDPEERSRRRGSDSAAPPKLALSPSSSRTESSVSLCEDNPDKAWSHSHPVCLQHISNIQICLIYISYNYNRARSYIILFIIKLFKSLFLVSQYDDLQNIYSIWIPNKLQ